MPNHIFQDPLPSMPSGKGVNAGGTTPSEPSSDLGLLSPPAKPSTSDIVGATLGDIGSSLQGQAPTQLADVQKRIDDHQKILAGNFLKVFDRLMAVANSDLSRKDKLNFMEQINTQAGGATNALVMGFMTLDPEITKAANGMRDMLQSAVQSGRIPKALASAVEALAEDDPEKFIKTMTKPEFRAIVTPTVLDKMKEKHDDLKLTQAEREDKIARENIQMKEDVKNQFAEAMAEVKAGNPDAVKERRNDPYLQWAIARTSTPQELAELERQGFAITPNTAGNELKQLVNRYIKGEMSAEELASLPEPAKVMLMTQAWHMTPVQARKIFTENLKLMGGGQTDPLKGFIAPTLMAMKVLKGIEAGDPEMERLAPYIHYVDRGDGKTQPVFDAQGAAVQRTIEELAGIPGAESMVPGMRQSFGVSSRDVKNRRNQAKRLVKDTKKLKSDFEKKFGRPMADGDVIAAYDEAVRSGQISQYERDLALDMMGIKAKRQR